MTAHPAQPWPRVVPPLPAVERAVGVEGVPLAAPAVSPGELVDAVWRRRVPLALWMMACLALAGWYLAVVPITFTSAATIILEPRQSLGSPLPAAQSVAAQALDIAQAESQIQVIRSERILATVFDVLGLKDALEFAEPGPGIRKRALIALGWSEPASAAEGERDARGYQAFADRVGVRRLGQSYVIDVSYQAQTPEQAARVANAIAVQYIKAQIDVKAAAAQQGTEYLRGRIANIEAEQRAAEEGVRRGRVPDVQFSDADARIIGAALRPINKSYPKTGLTLAFALTFGLLTGLLVVAVHHALDRTLRTRRQVRGALGVECLGVLPSVATARDLRRRGNLPLARIAADQPGCAFVQGLQRARTAVLLAGPTDRRRVIGVASWSRADGRSTVAAGLAHLLSRSNAAVDLVDADLQTPTLTRVFAPTAATGLNDMLVDREGVPSPPAHALTQTLGFVPAVGSGRTAEPDLYPGSEPMRALLTQLRAARNVIIDLPPLAGTSDALALCPYLDGVVLVVEAGRTTVEEASEAIRLLQAAGGPVLGVILNKAVPNRADRRVGR